MAFAEYGEYDGVGLAELVRTNQVSPSELVEEAIARIEAANPTLNAVVNRMYDFARNATSAGLPDGPFKGVPFLLKDLLAMVAGVPTSCGTRLLRSTPASHDNEIVRRFKAAGLVIVGKTNTPEFGMVPYTEPEAFGPTRNPWDTSRTPGGSSGGSAAAVASRMVPMAAGADGGGSIRIPAACCGVFGLKPTRGRTPTGPDIGEIWRGFVVEHALTRSVRDSAAMLDAIAGADVGAPYLAPAQSRPFLSEVTTEPGPLRVAFTAQPFLGNHVHPDCVKGLDQTVRLLQELGHDVFEAAPKIDAEAFSLAFMTVVAAEVRSDMEWAARLLGRAPSVGDFEDTTYALGLLGRAMGASEYSNATRELQVVAREVGRFFERCDVLLTPTLADPPVPIGSLQPSRRDRALVKVVGRLNAGWLLQATGVIRQLAAQAFGFMPYTPIFNVTGQPAMSVPLHWNDGGLPIGMHFVGRFGDEATLFRLAGQLERARPWSGRLPPANSRPGPC